ncbi:twin-arginine translocation signal domain-containing protein [Spirosoma endbachense]|uniref:Twin-arginine translocation signal domain-containing protein n=1 Tax=Spirosoma endbachense TaxID=2666025 RepID=A0A6P1W1K1_9BACT|nr:twin-arginine translocation signal domain-containing protein [Spirosoma endbachense]QHV98192.1 twin-arginine translocation signal domain-containing protein [Spirosoma endbachense]
MRRRKFLTQATVAASTVATSSLSAQADYGVLAAKPFTVKAGDAQFGVQSEHLAMPVYSRNLTK